MSATAVFAILASAVVVVGGLVAMVRAIWGAAQSIRDNRTATLANTKALDDLTHVVDGRIGNLERRVGELEARR
jgi:hypothetical protein